MEYIARLLWFLQARLETRLAVIEWLSVFLASQEKSKDFENILESASHRGDLDGVSPAAGLNDKPSYVFGPAFARGDAGDLVVADVVATWMEDDAIVEHGHKWPVQRVNEYTNCFAQTFSLKDHVTAFECGAFCKRAMGAPRGRKLAHTTTGTAFAVACPNTRL